MNQASSRIAMMRHRTRSS